MEFDTGARLVPYLDDFLTFAVIHITASQMFDCSQESGVRVRSSSFDMSCSTMLLSTKFRENPTKKEENFQIL